MCPLAHLGLVARDRVALGVGRHEEAADPPSSRHRGPSRRRPWRCQQSTFLFGTGRIEKWHADYKEIEIDATKKENIRETLKKSFGIGEQSLFNDLDGFARYNSHNRPYSLTTERLYSLGKSFHQQKNLNRAIECYERTIEYNPQFYKAYHDCRVARTQLLLREFERSWNCSLEKCNELWSKFAIKLQHSFLKEQHGCYQYIDGGLTSEQKEEQKNLKSKLKAYLEREHEGSWGKVENELGEDLNEDCMNSWGKYPQTVRLRTLTVNR